MTGQVAPVFAQQRVIRVFVSSTFRDMQAERGELVKRIFPQLRKLCEQRSVTWGEVDLRWGITDEQTAEGKVLPLCLEEIHRCRPYFIGLLGQRYGWVPDEIPQELIEREPWLAEHLQHSITELEILHGVLNNPEMAEHAYFYFRDPTYADALPAEERSAHREGPTGQEIEKYGPEEAERRAEGRRRKLAALKERIRTSDLPLRDNYRDPVELGQLVLRDMTALIDRLYPEGSGPDPLDREAAEHEAFAASRAGVYIGRQTYFDRLDAHAQGDGPPLVVLGASGSGKSALLANWALRYREAHPEDLVLMHFIGASPHSADWAAMLRRIMGEFKRRFDIQAGTLQRMIDKFRFGYDVQAEIPSEPDSLRAAFANWLHRAAARGRVVLVLDALNQLEDRDGAPDLVWLPPVLPANVRLVLSTLPDRPLEELEKRGWPTLQVEPLEPDERRRLIAAYLAQYTKSLSPARVERIAGAAQAANPLYLRALLEELRVFGVHEMLDQRIDHYLAAGTVEALYGKVLERYEEDYERDRPGLVGEAMTLLWAARRGLSEAELLELLGSNGEPLPRAYWSPLHLAAEQSLVSRAGLIGFFHNYFREAVQAKYLPTEDLRKSAHLRLADYFQKGVLTVRRLSDPVPEGLYSILLPVHHSHELPWQLAQARLWERLTNLLCDPVFLQIAWHLDKYDVMGYWSQIEANSSCRAPQAYAPLIEDEDPARSDLALLVARLFCALGYSEHALAIIGKRAEGIRQFGDRRALADALVELGVALQYRGDLQEALSVAEEAETVFRRLRDMRGVAACIHEQALILRNWGQLDPALKMHRKTERFFRKTGDNRSLASCLYGQSVILLAKGATDQATHLLSQVERMMREEGDLDGLQMCLGGQAQALASRGELEKAMAKHKEEERICHEIGKRESLARSLANQAQIMRHRGELDGAMKVLKQQEQISTEIGGKRELQYCYYFQASIMKDRNEYAEAMRLLKRQEQLTLDLGDQLMLQQSIGLRAEILAEQDEHEAAMALLKRQEQICRTMNYETDLHECLDAQAMILLEMDNAEDALELFRQQEGFWRRSGKWDRVLVSLLSQGSMYSTSFDDPAHGLRLLDEALKIANEQSLEDSIEVIREAMRGVYLLLLMNEGRASGFEKAQDMTRIEPGE